MKLEKSKLYEIIMSALALLVLALLATEYTMDISNNMVTIFAVIDLSIMFIFTVDYLYRFIKSGNKLHFFLNNIFDLISIIPFDRAFRVARLTRLLRLTKLSRAAKFTRLLIFMRRFTCDFLKLLKTNGLHKMIMLTVVIIIGGAFGIMHFERPYGNIKSFGDAVWWSLVTTTTVGYGDISPVSSGGRILAGILMIVGIGFLGMVTGSIATFFLEKKPDGNSGNIKDKTMNFSDFTDDEYKQILHYAEYIKSKR